MHPTSGILKPVRDWLRLYLEKRKAIDKYPIKLKNHRKISPLAGFPAWVLGGYKSVYFCPWSSLGL
jgi:hypothetical protein